MGCGYGMMMCMVFVAYAYGFGIGGYFVYQGFKNTNFGKDEPYTSGEVMSCFFGIIFGVMALGMNTPNVKALYEGRIAMNSALEIIDRVPAIDMDDHRGRRIGDVSGRIEFRNVSFRYSLYF